MRKWLFIKLYDFQNQSKDNKTIFCINVAVYFKASWQDSFYAELTQKQIFHSSADEKYQVQEEIESVYRDAIEYTAGRMKSVYILKLLIKEIDEVLTSTDNGDKKLYWILFEVLCFEYGHLFYGMLSDSRDSDMYDLVPDEAGKVEIYGIKHDEKLSKSAKI